jgi:hypothetical protein
MMPTVPTNWLKTENYETGSRINHTGGLVYDGQADTMGTLSSVMGNGPDT